MILLYITIGLFILYSFLIVYYSVAWNSIPVYAAPATPPGTPISIIIPARNEASNIGALLNAIEQQSYTRALIEIIVIDDHSTDQTADIVRQFPGVRLLQLKEDNINSYKKKRDRIGNRSGYRSGDHYN